MPTYEYECAQCATTQDEVRPMANRNDPGQCGKCGGIAVRVILTAPLGQPDIKPYVAVAGDRAGRMITSRREHREFLKRNNFREAGDQKSPERGKHAPMQRLKPSSSEVRERRETLREVLHHQIGAATLARTT